MIRVLIVDDSPDVAESISGLLALQGDIVTAGVLHRADGLLEHAASLDPDVILLDLSMPGADPLVTLRELSAKRPSSRVLVCSAYDDDSRRDMAREAGALGYVSKLDDVQAIVQAIRTVARGQAYPD